MSSVLALLKSIFWASLARLSDIDKGLKHSTAQNKYKISGNDLSLLSVL
jgi:hypothetical protein